jgi:hypothetical protein
MKLEFYIDQISGAGEYRPKPDYSDLKFSIQNDNGKGKFSCSGNIVLYGADYDYFIGTIQGWAAGYTMYITNNGATFLEVDFKSVVITSQNESLKKIWLQIKPDTTYTWDAWALFDTEYNINEIPPESNDLIYTSTYIEHETTSGAFTDKRLNSNLAVNSNLGSSGWDIESIDIDFGQEDPVGSGNWYYDGTVNYARQRGRGYYIGTTAYVPNTDAGWVYDGDVTIDDRTYPEYYRPTGANTYTFPSVEPYAGGSQIVNSSSIYSLPPITYTGVTRTVQEVIVFLFGKMGLSLSIDNGGTTTDSYYSFKTLTGTSLTYGGVTTNKYLNRLLVMNLTDFVPAADDMQKDVPASETMVSLKTILEFFERRGFEWWIEDRTGVYYFVLKHKYHKTLGSGNPNLANYKGRNWNREDAYEIENPEYHVLQNETENNTIDFKGTDLIMSEIYSTDAKSSFNDGNVYVDLDDIADKRHDVYDEFTNNNIVIISAQSGTTADYVRQSNGLLSGNPRSNSELSFPFACRSLIADLPDTAVSVNGSSFTAEKWRLKKRSKVTVNIPTSVNILTDFDVHDYVSHYVDSCEIEQISQKADENIYNLTLMK